MLSEPAGCCSFQDRVGAEHARCRREHGLQLPLHPLQVVGWLAFVLFVASSYFILIPAIRPPWQQALLALLSTLYLLHAVTHLAALLTDPAEAPVRRDRGRSVVPEFDRSKHAHVIENGRCHLCNIQTSGGRTKHCSLCNKCVARFDHHCKWLNQCVGERNYAAFLMCVTTAMATAVVVAIVAVSELVLYYVEPQWLILWDTASVANKTLGTTTLASSFVNNDTVFLVLIAVLGLLAAITAGLLLHLFFFHVYISFLGLTTYEYIRTQRQNQNTSNVLSPTQIPSTNTLPSIEENNKNSVQTHCFAAETDRPSSLRCCQDQSHITVFACAFLEQCTERCNSCLVEEEQTETKACSTITSDGAEVPEIGISSTKKVRMQHKWNCCLSVPDSPDDPSTSTNATQRISKSKCLLSWCKYKANNKTITPGSTESKNHHGYWPGTRIRVLFRVFGQWGYNRRYNRQQHSTPARNNQVVPLSDSNNDGGQSTNGTRPPRLPALPPPPRRRLSNGDPVLTNILSLHPKSAPTRPLRNQIPLYYKRRRRSIAHHRPKTTTLSPIRESGLSNPASPSHQGDCDNTVALVTETFSHSDYR